MWRRRYSIPISGLNPVSAGDVIRVPLPALTEERRKEMTKVVRHEAENARVAIRNIRRDANQHLKGLIKDEHLAKDDEHRAEDEVQKLTDQFVTQVDELLKAKEQDSDGVLTNRVRTCASTTAIVYEQGSGR